MTRACDTTLEHMLIVYIYTQYYHTQTHITYTRKTTPQQQKIYQNTRAQ